VARRVRSERREDGDRVNASATDAVCVTQLRNDACRAVGTRRDDANAGHRCEVPDERRHRHLVQQRVPDLGRGQVVRLEGLARQAVLANECRRLLGSRCRLRTVEALDDARQTGGVAAADDPLEQASVLVRDVDRRVARADPASRMRQTQ
jgi:hypothetical protein